MNKRKVELIGVLKSPHNNLWGPEDYAVSGAMGCFDGRCSLDIHEDHAVKKVPQGKRKLDWNATREVILRETSGRGHGAVLDQSCFVFSLDNVTRATTLLLCAPQYADHLQQSLRREVSEKGFLELSVGDFSLDSEGNDLMKRQFSLYERMVSAGVPYQDARFILPLNTRTAIQTKLDARELMHLKSIAEKAFVPQEVRETVEQMYEEALTIAPGLMKERGPNFEVLSWMPAPQLFYLRNNPLFRLIASKGRNSPVIISHSSGVPMNYGEIERAVRDRNEALLANLKSTHFNFLVPMSLATFHQATRQRTWDQSVESIIDALNRGRYITPGSVSTSEFNREYGELSEEGINFSKHGEDNPNYFGVIPHNLQVFDLIHLNGWNALHSIGKRTCTTAQWEIRDLARSISHQIREVDPDLGDFIAPQGRLYGYCPERENCGRCKN